MKVFKSIKWRLQMWYGLILVAVLAGFGVTSFQLERNRQFSRVDAELQRRFGVIMNALRPRHGPGPDEHRFPPPGAMPAPPERMAKGDFSTGFRLPPQAQGLFETNDVDGFYFVMWRGTDEVARGGNVPSLAATDFAGMEPASPPSESGPPPPRTRKHFREIVQTTPAGDTVVVGCNIQSRLHELRMAALTLAGCGGIILILGLAGGGWLVSRALRPIDSISDAAVKISGGDLAQRINIAETESELGRLAAVLNSTFSRLEGAFEQQKQFASDAAHELRTPVAVILTQAQAALHRERSGPEYQAALEACQRAAQRMRKLIASLLELARLDAGQEPMRRASFDFSRTVAEAVELVRPLAAEREVEVSAGLKPVNIHGDAERLGQVILNLLTNAVQYNHAGGHVRATLEASGGLVLLTVNNSGPAILPADLPHLFKRFYRADPSRSSGNAGLGLAISKAIVEAHGGTIEAASDEASGTTFTVRLPSAPN